MNQPDVAQLASNFLAIAYSIARGHPTTIVWKLRGLRARAMTTDEMATAAAQYLVNAGFAFWGKEDDDLGIVVTRAGWAEAEQQIELMSAQLPPPTTINITGSNIGGIQQGTVDSVQTVHQDATISPVDVLAIRGFILEARQNLEALDPDLQPEAELQLETLEREASSDRPRGRTIAQALSALRGIAYGIAASGTWQVLQPLIDRFI